LNIYVNSHPIEMCLLNNSRDLSLGSSTTYYFWKGLNPFASIFDVINNFQAIFQEGWTSHKPAGKNCRSGGEKPTENFYKNLSEPEFQ